MMLALAVSLYAFLAALLAAWTDARWPRLRPGFTIRLLALVLSALVVQALAARADAYTRAGKLLARVASYHPAGVQIVSGHTATKLGPTLLAVLVLAYSFLVCLWTLRAVLDHVGQGGGGIPAKL